MSLVSGQSTLSCRASLVHRHSSWFPVSVATMNLRFRVRHSIVQSTLLPVISCSDGMVTVSSSGELSELEMS